MKGLGIFAAVFTLDTVLKHYVDHNFPVGKKKWILGKRILIHKYYNKGAALNILSDAKEVLKGVHAGTFLVLAGIFMALLKKEKDSPFLISLGMALGGGASNLSDRLLKGHVVDYFSFQTPWEKLNKIVFNISDFFIFLGIISGCIFSKDYL